MKKTDTFFEYFVFYLSAPTILLLGLLGNLMGLLVLLRKQLKKLGPQNMYRYLFVYDSIALLSLLKLYLLQTFNIDFRDASRVHCKLYMYFTYSTTSVSPLLLVYILGERYLSIKYPVESNLMRKSHVQFVYLLIIILFSLIYYIQVPFYYDLHPIQQVIQEKNSTQFINKSECLIIGNKRVILSYFVFTYRILFTFALMLLFSILLIQKIIKTRNRVSTFYSRKEKIIFKKDIELSVMAIIMSFIFIGINVYAFMLVYYYDKSMGSTFNIVYVFNFHIFFFSYAFNFYYFLMLNSMFRHEFLAIVKRSSTRKDTISSIQLKMEVEKS